ncbi:MAG: GNAT family N-acetyltransferase [Clostridiales bacterium]|nr:GNAT family N-acetyltransferase [Clostridiales bacterium]
MEIVRTELTPEIRELRIRVFCCEQGYPQEKLFDEHDNTAGFLAVSDNGRIAGCGRFYEVREGIFHIDNIALSEEIRGAGWGKKLVNALLAECKKQNAEEVTVNAESYAAGFYEKCGFSVCGGEFRDENFKRTPLKNTNL